MQSTEILSKIGQDFSRIFFNNASSIEGIDNPKSNPPLSLRGLSGGLKHHAKLIRQDLHDVLQANRELMALLHVAIKDFPVNKQELDKVYGLMQPDELGELPKAKIEATDEYFAKEAKLPWAIWKRMKGDLNNGDKPQNNN